MNCLEVKLAEMKRRSESALIPFLTAGDPDADTTEKLMLALAANGADVMELGVPFSDPLADGPVLQAAAERALARGMTPEGALALAARFTRRRDTPLILLLYYNLIFRRGPADFCRAAAAAGVSGLVVPDLPFEEAGKLDGEAERAGLVNIRFLSLTTSEERMEQICRNARGFIYCVAVTGVTGERAGMDPLVAEMVRRARKYTDVPLALGFGITSPAQAARAAASADAVVVGSALVKEIAAATGAREKVKKAGSVVRALKAALEGDRGCI